MSEQSNHLSNRKCFEEKHKIWDIKFKQIPVWSYLRGDYFNQHLPFKPKIKFTLNDLQAIIQLISLLWIKNSIVIFISGRKDLSDYANIISGQFPNSKIFIFKRYEGDQDGNVLILETIRQLFRKTFWIFHYSDYKNITLKIKNIDNNIKTSLMKNLIGDYYFNRLIKIFLKNSKKVFYTNAVIPKVERYLHMYNSSEIQHGVIHNQHLDYVDTPYIINDLTCYSNLVKNNLLAWGFSGNIFVIKKTSSPKMFKKYKIAIFGTIDKKYSLYIEKFVIIYTSMEKEDVKVKLHPRDLHSYTQNVLDKAITSLSPLEVEIPILPDTSLISDCFLNKEKFIYLALDDNKSIDEIHDYIVSKYNIYNSNTINNFLIARNHEELLSCIKAIKHENKLQ